MKDIFMWCTKVAFLLILVVPLATNAQSVVANESAYRTILLELIATLQQQIRLLQSQLEASSQRVVTEGGMLSAEVDSIASYQIFSPSSVDTISDPEHRRYFSRVFEIFPDEYDTSVGEVSVYSSESSTFDSFVETLPPTHKQWMYAVNESVLGEPLADWNTELIVHELAHLVSYEVITGANSNTETCNSYFERHGCPLTNSYLGRFIDEFWDTADLERAERFAELDDGYETAYAYYDKHETDYVSDYAAIAPEEDFTESLMYFILDKKISGSEAVRKVTFFEQYPDLRVMKTEVQESL